jgi:hypothetical protein
MQLAFLIAILAFAGWLALKCHGANERRKDMSELKRWERVKKWGRGR